MTYYIQHNGLITGHLQYWPVMVCWKLKLKFETILYIYCWQMTGWRARYFDVQDFTFQIYLSVTEYVGKWVSDNVRIKRSGDIVASKQFRRESTASDWICGQLWSSVGRAAPSTVSYTSWRLPKGCRNYLMCCVYMDTGGWVTCAIVVIPKTLAERIILTSFNSSAAWENWVVLQRGPRQYLAILWTQIWKISKTLP